ncbi:MAG: hypothetical protein ACI88A_005000 [Paraglaciecola sp.]|jgi:hypothetical protein
MKIFISFIIAVFNFCHKFETLQCSDFVTYTYYRFENTFCYQAHRDWSIEDIS